MITITTHVLDSVHGIHAAGMRVSCYRIGDGGKRHELFDVVTDQSGRISQNITSIKKEVACELVFQVGEYFTHDNSIQASTLHEAVIRFHITEAEAVYHMPMMVSVNSYSVWLSRPG